MLIDCHVHVVAKHTVPRANGDHFATGEELVPMLDDAGIAMAVVLPLVSPEARWQLSTSEEVLEVCSRWPDRLIPFCCVDPRMGANSPKSDLSPHFEYYKSAGCKGVGEMTANLPFDDPMVWNLFKHCSEYEMPVTFHISPAVGVSYGLADELGLPRLERTLKQFPDLAFLGHSQPFWAEVTSGLDDQTRRGYPKGKVLPGGRTVELFERYENLYGDLSAGSGFNAISRDPEFGYPFLERFQDRMLFGTDICAPGQELPIVPFMHEAVEQGHISRDAYENITWRNLNDLLDLGVE